MTGIAAAPHPAAQLVQLRQTEAFGVFDNHQARVRYIDAHLDNRSRHQQCGFPGPESEHCLCLVGGLHAAMQQPDTELRQCAAQFFRRCFGRLRLQDVTFLDQGTYPVRLAAYGAGSGYPANHFSAPAAVYQ